MSDWRDITATAMDDALGYMQADSVTYQGVTVNSVASERESQTLAIGGFESHFIGSVRLAKAGFPTPVKGTKLTLNGRELRIGDIAEDPISWTLYLEDPSR
jgi:hypothetical protein